MMANNVRVTTEMEQNLQRYEELGQTVVLAAVDGRRDYQPVSTESIYTLLYMITEHGGGEML